MGVVTGYAGWRLAVRIGDDMTEDGLLRRWGGGRGSGRSEMGSISCNGRKVTARKSFQAAAMVVPAVGGRLMGKRGGKD
ncbi:hypothetical protein Tco_0992812 [Tanacetum coccineum]|uniref:Uncharacterized protein n=1 Tax=Tanacetum coccineum TaxID=301880 RepID=A0ABQ5F3W7_9ASTR